MCSYSLNREYKLTIDALEQTKEYLEQVPYINPASHGKKNLSINKTKKSTNVIVCLPSSTMSNRSPFLSISKHGTFPSVKFPKPKLVKPLELDTFVSATKSELVLTKEENQSENSLQEEETTYTIETFL
jgi:hypothetical protein